MARAPHSIFGQLCPRIGSNSAGHQVGTTTSPPLFNSQALRAKMHISFEIAGKALPAALFRSEQKQACPTTTDLNITYEMHLIVRWFPVAAALQHQRSNNWQALGDRKEHPLTVVGFPGQMLWPITRSQYASHGKLRSTADGSLRSISSMRNTCLPRTLTQNHSGTCFFAGVHGSMANTSHSMCSK